MEGAPSTSVWSGITAGVSASPSAKAKADGRVSIVIFARLPTPGRVKTRLAAGPGVGPEGACRFYRACAEHIIQQAASCADWADVTVYHSSADVTSEVAAWLQGEGLTLPCEPQLSSGCRLVKDSAGGGGVSGGGDLEAPQPDLGAKMLQAMTEARTRSGARKVLITGTDIPDLSSRLLVAAAAALDEHELVVGPSLDGGYYLLGLTQLERTLFEGMQWSTDGVLRDTLSRAAAAGLRVAPLATLPHLRDVDTLQDLRMWVAERDANPAEPVAVAPPGYHGCELCQQDVSERLGWVEAGNTNGMVNRGEESEAGIVPARLTSRSVVGVPTEADKPGGCPAADSERQAVLRQLRLLQVSREVVAQAAGAVRVI